MATLLEESMLFQQQQQQQQLFSYGSSSNNLYAFLASLHQENQEHDHFHKYYFQQQQAILLCGGDLKYSRSWDHAMTNSSSSPVVDQAPATTSGRRKRRRTRSCKKSKVELEKKRMIHISVERNRRKQMNQHLAALRSLMPTSYVQRGDQASIVGGAINFVKELENVLQTLEANKQIKNMQQWSNGSEAAVAPEKKETPFTAEVRVTMVEGFANVKVQSRRRRRHELLKMVVGLQSLCLTVLHLNVTTLHHCVLYSFSLKVEEKCELNSVNEIGAAVHEMLGRIQQEDVN